MPKYKVKETGFFGGVLRVPGGRHDPVVTAKPIPTKEIPSWLELMKVETKTKKQKGEAASSVTEPNADSSDFLGGEDGVETF